MSNFNLLDLFVGRTVIVSIHGYLISGRLLEYVDSERGKPHRPCVLVLGTREGKTLVRGNWEVIHT